MRLRRLAAAPLLLLLLLAGGLATDSGRAGPTATELTIATRPASVGPRGLMVTVYGAVDNGQAGELVDIEAKDCGAAFFHGVAGATTTAGGRYSADAFYRITTTFRAVWRDQVSDTVVVHQRPNVGISKERAQRFRVSASGLQSFWRKRVLVQRRASGGWRTLKSVSLTRAGSGDYYAIVKLAVPKGTLLRAHMPLSQARPCYLAGTSESIRA